MDTNQIAPMPLCTDDAGCRPGLVPPFPPSLPPQPPVNGGDNRPPINSIDPALLSLAMAFVPYQTWETPYEPAVALRRGTIFPALDKPFIGEEAVRRD